jgi:hypothetical protein
VLAAHALQDVLGDLLAVRRRRLHLEQRAEPAEDVPVLR